CYFVIRIDITTILASAHFIRGIEAKFDDTCPSFHPQTFASPGVQRHPEIFFRLVQVTYSALLECMRSIDESLLVKIESGGPKQYFATWFSSSFVISLLPILLPLTFTT
ncbi:unnamed protein product, partial [Musa textilis]